ncbi:olfactory receptor-like protein I9 [Hyla sarda]|uniref:olfactory receptor-like protein I9 n=1 Tax=Hyla sarda TaxID=327740 RepID=UPI0024C30AD1|nr:olfactory receptor-like protein I9 [Hyla sarda]
MENNNITKIFLLGFPGLYNVRIFVFLLILIIYLTTICGNLLVISLVSYSKNLHCPMYFFLAQLTMCDIIITSDIVPNMLPMVLNNGTSMSLLGCLTQFFFFGSSEGSECLLLTVMSYDRYLAICHPLHYVSIMNPRLCLEFILISWTLGFTLALLLTLGMSQLLFCRSGVIDHFFCDFDPLLRLSCSDTLQTKIHLLSTILNFPVILCPFLVVLVSYAYIVHTILRIQSISHRRKAFSTCGSHLTVVSIFYGTLLSIYLSPENGKKSVTLPKMMSLAYTVLTPLTNPVIYCLRNKDIKKAFKIF